ncbi:MAG TPA: flagellar basal body protein [Bryobacteraceae bacterium]|nr:flagellar basal body protein [Bryobacteraceae bacterium]
MSVLSERQKLVASNIANADTPGYKTQDIDFQAALENAMSGNELSAQVVQPEGLPVKADGNNVNLDRESRLLSENAMRFAIATQFAHADLATLRMAINDGRSG